MKQEFLPHGIELIEKISVILNNKYYETANRVIRVKIFDSNGKSQLIILLGAYVMKWKLYKNFPFNSLKIIYFFIEEKYWLLFLLC